MQKLIHTAVHKALTERPSRRYDDMLWVSDLGRNPYGALRRILTGELEPFDFPTHLKMDGGNALEAFTLRQVAENLERPVQTQFPLFDDIWTGYADLVIGHGTDDVIIYDHKGSCGKWWDYKASLPRTADCCQVWLYGQLYYKQYGVKPRLGLYYRGWGAWAEFEIEMVGVCDYAIKATGYVTDEKGITENAVTRIREADPFLLCDEIETLYLRVKSGDLTEVDLEAMAPDGPDWDYAEDTTRRLRNNE
ncbi:MAG: hypothetical protein KDJ65_38745 [Anaerolineae bacterium]|nr:hypothetical protein [Anaerolineae bacterium]